MSTCSRCDSGYVLVRKYTAALNSSNMSTNWSTLTCVKKSSTYKEIDNCDQTMYTEGTGVTTVKVCTLCNENYTPATVDTTHYTGYTTCTKTLKTANCKYAAGYSSNYATGNQGTTCVYCKEDFAMDSTGLVCLSYTKDSNCSKLILGGAACQSCWWSYYFDGTKCKLASSLISFAFIGLASLIALF